MFTINNKTDTSDIAKEFQQHFSRLLNAPRVECINNDESNKNLLKILKEPSLDDPESFYVSITDVYNAVNKLHRHKLRDPFELQAEHFICGVNR